MRLLMLSGDRQTSIGEVGPFHALQREFSKHFERIDVLCPRPSKPQTVHVVHDHVHLHTAPCGRAGMVSWLSKRGLELASETQPSLVISHDYGWFYNGFAAARISSVSGVPYLSEIHHVPGHPVAADLRERFDKRIARAYVTWAKSRCAAFRVVNHVEMPALLRSWGVPAEKIRVLPSLYIDFGVFSRPRKPQAPEQDVLFVGRMVNNKGLDRIVDALARSKEPRTALFVGKGPLREATMRRAQAKGLGDRARFVEWLATPEDLADAYRKSRVVVCASTCEGGPRVTIEAMACGTPVVSTEVGVMGEVLVDGVNGRLARFDVESLAQGIDDVLSDEARRLAMGERASEVARRFEYRATIRGYADGVKTLAAEARASR